MILRERSGAIGRYVQALHRVYLLRDNQTLYVVSADITSIKAMSQTVSNGNDRLGGEPIVDPNYMEEMEEYSIFFNPVKFSIMMQLSQSIDILSADLRDRLGVSWGRFISSINSLADEGMIIYSNEFSGGKQRRLLSISHKGMEIYSDFMDMITESWKKVEY